jgi:ketosteroid isomerase-like protein
VSQLERFFAYAAAFEKAFATDDWSLVAAFFTEDAVYEVPLDPPLGGRFEGRPAILDYFKDVTSRFDRHFESREIAVLEGPRQEGTAVWVRGRAVYRAAGVPQFVLELEETAHFEGDRIGRLEDCYQPAMQKEMRDYTEKHGAKLGLGELSGARR